MERIHICTALLSRPSSHVAHVQDWPCLWTSGVTFEKTNLSPSWNGRWQIGTCPRNILRLQYDHNTNSDKIQNSLTSSQNQSILGTLRDDSPIYTCLQNRSGWLGMISKSYCEPKYNWLPGCLPQRLAFTSVCLSVCPSVHPTDQLYPFVYLFVCCINLLTRHVLQLHPSSTYPLQDRKPLCTISQLCKDCMPSAICKTACCLKLQSLQSTQCSISACRSRVCTSWQEAV